MSAPLDCWSDGPVRVLIADVRDGLAQLADESVQCGVTSPPYWGLRDFGITGQMGLEATPDEYVARMVAVFSEVRRVLRKDGTLWLNLGDAYAHGTPGAGSVFDNGRQDGRKSYEADKARGREKVATLAPGLKSKDLIGIPWRVAFALQADGWWLRSDIIWSKPNPMPESVTDRPTKAHEYLFLMAKAERYYYDADAIRTPLQPKTFTTFGTLRHDPGDGSGLVKSENFGRAVPVRTPRLRNKQRGHGRRHTGFNDRWDGMARDEQQLAGANARSVWEIATQPYPEAHFATFPEALVEPCIKAGSREGDVVLDPFAGSGTTLAVARRLGRKAIGIELQPKYLPLIQRRVSEAALPLVEAM